MNKIRRKKLEEITEKFDQMEEFVGTMDEIFWKMDELSGDLGGLQ